MISEAVTVTTTRVKLISDSTSWRKIYLHVIGNEPIYLGGNNVTTANGLTTEKHTSPIEIDVPAQEELWAISASSVDVRVLRPSLYVD